MEPAVDARIARTQQQLRSAALTLAAGAPIEDISVADLAREAGINRATFYKHADSPLQVLREALVADLDSMRTGFLEAAAVPQTDLVQLWREAAHGTAAHVARFADVYRRGFSDDASGSLQTLLSRHIATSMEALFNERPELMPAHRRKDVALLSAAYASFLGNGLTGILQVWFNSGSRDVELYADAVINALPVWMLNPPATQDTITRARTSRPKR